jgi:hypothetical protein
MLAGMLKNRCSPLILRNPMMIQSLCMLIARQMDEHPAHPHTQLLNFNLIITLIDHNLQITQIKKHKYQIGHRTYTTFKL